MGRSYACRSTRLDDLTPKTSFPELLHPHPRPLSGFPMIARHKSHFAQYQPNDLEEHLGVSRRKSTHALSSEAMKAVGPEK